MARDERDVGEDRDARDERHLSDPADPRDQRVVPLDARDARLPGDPRDERTPFDTATTLRLMWLERLAKAPLCILIAAFLGFASGLWLQPDRWEATPAYGELLVLAPQPVWGICYGAAAVALSASLYWRRNLIAVASGHILAGMLIVAWWVAFLVRWATNSATTAVNPINWAVLLALLVLSALLLIPVARRS